MEFSDDPLLSDSARREAGDGRGGDGVVDPTRDEAGGWHVQRDIVLGRNNPGYSR